MNLNGWTPEDAYLVAESAYELYLEGKIEEAAIIFEGLLAIDPGNSYCCDAMAAISLSLGRPEDTVRHASEALKVAPAHFEALSRRCEAYLQLGRLEAAKRDLAALDQLKAAPHRWRMRVRLENVARFLNGPKNGQSLTVNRPFDATTDSSNAITGATDN
jgi:tetratricopeptide (TPR) repeat protein